MANLTRCRYCGSYPNYFNMSGGWNIYCDCMFGAGAANDFFAYWDEAVNYWNANYGKIEDGGTEVTCSAPPVCTCDSRELMWYGCRCKYAEWKKNKRA